MDRARLASLPAEAVAFDVETELSQPGLLAPPLACGALCVYRDGRFLTELLDVDATLDAILQLLEDERRVIVGAHIPYDLLVCAVEWSRRGRDILPLIFRAYEQGRIYCVLVGEALGAIADGCLYKDPRTGGDLRDPITGEPRKYYSLEIVTHLRLGRRDAKANDAWRLKYGLLRGVPIAQWPQDAIDYPQDDVRNTLEDCFAQTGHIPSALRHRWRTSMSEEYDQLRMVWQDAQQSGHPEAGKLREQLLALAPGDPADQRYACENCGLRPEAVETADPICWAVKPARNLHQMADQAYTAWALHLGAAWGFDVDQDAVDEEVSRVEMVRAAAAPKLVEWGLLKWKREKGELKLGESKSKVSAAVAAAYGARGHCPTCDGLGKVVSQSKKMPTRRAWDPEKDGINCVECCGTGFDLSTAPDLPMTEPSDKFPRGQVKADADTLFESGDERLFSLGDYKEDAKTVTNYGPYLRKAKKPSPAGLWERVPLTLWPNVLLETDRTSYADAIQQFPRDGALRACIRARDGFVLCSCDYNQGEVITHAQSCLWILGYSNQAEMILAGRELHSMFGSVVMNVDYDEFFKNKKKNKAYANARQAAKPWIFGKPGRMGAVKLVQAQRRGGPDTPCERGPVMIKNDAGELVPGFRGLRFCILMDGAEECGVDKVTWWGKPGYERQISPTCRRCLECAERLQAQYYETFPECRPYFNFCESVLEDGQPLTDEQCDIIGLPRGSQLAPGERCHHVSCIIQGGLKGNDCCNGYFQSLLAVASKRALRQAQRECADVTARVPTDMCRGGKVSKFAGQVSPLLGSRCIVLQHDEILAELRQERASAAAERLSEIMVRAFQECCPDLAPACKAPPAIARRWWKAMEPVRHAGILVPWTPEHNDKTCPECLADAAKAAA